MFRKITVIILAASLAVFSLAAASAEGSGLFGELSRKDGADERLSVLDSIAEPIAVSLTTDSGVTVEIPQAYCEGDTVFVAYRLSGGSTRIDLHEGAPEEEISWDDVYENHIAARDWANENPSLQKAVDWLDGNGQRWASLQIAGINDGLEMEGGAYADIFAGDETTLKDGSVIGWKECRIPAENLADTMTFSLVLSCSRTVLFQDGSTFKQRYENAGRTEVSFTVNRSGAFPRLHGVSPAAAYQAEAEMAPGNVDFRGTVRVISPEQAAVWDSWYEDAGNSGPEVILSWNLYQDGRLLSEDMNGACQVNEAGEVVYEVQFPRVDRVYGLTLIPVFSESGERPGEAIPLAE